MSQLLFRQFQPLDAIATTATAAQTLQPLCQATGATLWLPESLKNSPPSGYIKNYQGSLQAHIASLWKQKRALVFSLATGAVVRLIAPLLTAKDTDPAVVVLDPKGHFVVSLCSGHQGGADQLTQLIASLLGATPVLTGAAASLELPGIDILGTPFGWQRGVGDWTGVSAAIARGDVVGVVQQAGSTLWQSHLPKSHTFCFEGEKTAQAQVYIGIKQNSSPSENLPKVQWHPRVLWLGMGCERGISALLIQQSVDQVFQEFNLAQGAIAGVATIDLKADETGIVDWCRQRNLPLKTFNAETLRQVEVANPSPIVAQTVGTPSVAEAAALVAAKRESSLSHLIVPKQICRLPTEAGALTIAIAQGEVEYTGRSGKLYLVGMGPGSLEQMTPAAQTAVRQADAVIGYSLYIDLIRPLQRPGQITEALPITQEKERAQRAIELAQWGLDVAVVSSGDCGIYGMAGLVFELLQTQGWDGKTPQVEVFPGISALQASAARVGAPLMHDFCAISLSDLLTPWEVILKRLEASAQADFITALYNPRSRNRTTQIVQAREIFLHYRDPQTPVAIVQSAYREQEKITLTTLEKMLDSPIDMLTTVLIGNRSSRTHGDWLITPRGYLKD